MKRWLMRARRILPWRFLAVLLVQHFVLGFHITWAAQQTTATASSQTDTLKVQTVDWTTVVLQIVLFLTTVSGFGYTIYRENRNRKWDLEDRAAGRQQAIQRQNEISEKVDQKVGELTQKIEENTQLTVDSDERLKRLLDRIMNADGTSDG